MTLPATTLAPGSLVPTGLTVRGLSVKLGPRTVLHDVDFSVGPGELVALVGPNGAGKSTLLRALAGLLEGGLTANPRRVAFLAQNASCAWGLTVGQVAALGRIPHRDTARAPVERALAACGIAGLRHQRVDRISGGEARRAMLARTYATEPDVFLLDEPTTDLDPAARFQLMQLLRDTADGGRAVVTVLHEVDLALHYADRVVVMEHGRLVSDTSAREALPAIAAAFGLPFGVDPAPRLLPPEWAPSG